MFGFWDLSFVSVTLNPFTFLYVLGLAITLTVNHGSSTLIAFNMGGNLDWAAVGNALDAHFRNVCSLQIPQNGTKYNIKGVFRTFGYWVAMVDKESFDATLNNGILYREDIVNDLVSAVKNAFGCNGARGVLVEGPHGVGKSHSLVNLVLKLQWRGDCLVTFVPDCGKWDHPIFMLTMICGSFGTTPDALGWSGQVTDEAVYHFGNKIQWLLADRGKRWVLVFDQINKLFTKCRTNKVYRLDRQYRMIDNVRSVGQVISVLSVSTNNEKVHVPASFGRYSHRIDMEDAELKLLFSKLAVEDVADDVKRTAGGHPGSVAKYMGIKTTFLNALYNDVHMSVDRLMIDFACVTSIPRKVMEAVVLSVLGQSHGRLALWYDKKFLVP
jgi:hypothetical protein